MENISEQLIRLQDLRNEATQLQSELAEKLVNANVKEVDLGSSVARLRMSKTGGNNTIAFYAKDKNDAHPVKNPAGVKVDLTNDVDVINVNAKELDDTPAFAQYFGISKNN